MKNVKLLCCMMIAFLAEAWAASTDRPHHQIIGLSDLNDKIVQDFYQGRRSDLIVACPEGTSLPFKIILKGQFLALESAALSPLYLKVLKTCYVRCEGQENFLFSTNLQTWKQFSEFFTGVLKVSVNTENSEPIAGLELELNQRTNK